MDATGFHTEYVYGEKGKMNTKAAEAYENLKKASLDSNTGIKEVSALQAQQYANKGYTVVTALDENGHKKNESGHIATVRPNTLFPSEVLFNGPTIANVGIKNGIMSTSDSNAYGKLYKNGNVHFFVDLNPFLSLQL